MCPHQVFCSFRSLPAPSFFLRVSNIQQQLAQLANESWPGMTEGTDGDRRRSAEDVVRLEEERRRLEEEIQRARATSAQGATERCVAFQDSGSRGYHL